MSLEVDEIKKLATKALSIKRPQVFLLSEGYGNYNYKIEGGGKEFVLRIKKSGERQFEDSLEREYVFYKYFEFKGIDFCPKAIFYDKKKNFLIESFLSGEKIYLKNLSKKQTDLFAKQLYQLFSLDGEDFLQFCKKFDLKYFGQIDPIEELKKYGFNRFELAKKGEIDERILDWIKQKLDENLRYLKSLKIADKRGVTWGDIQSSVIINEQGDIFFYDFEHARISDSPGLSYIKIHSKLSKSHFNYLVERYSYYSQKNKKDLFKEIVSEERIIRINDVVWAAMKWAETGEKKFEKVMHQRIKLAKEKEEECFQGS